MLSGTNQQGREAWIDTTGEGTGRIEAFSDGVMAIAITLLILEIKVPHISQGAAAEASLGEALLKLWPSYIGFFTSFLVIGIIWMNHHQVFKLIERTNQSFLAINVLFLMVVSFLPFPTALLAEYLRENRDQQMATLVYSGAMLAMAIAYNVLWRYASTNGRLLGAGVPSAVVKNITTKYNIGLTLYAVAFGLAFINYQVSLGLIVALALYFLLPSRPVRVEQTA